MSSHFHASVTNGKVLIMQNTHHFTFCVQGFQVKQGLSCVFSVVKQQVKHANFPLLLSKTLYIKLPSSITAFIYHSQFHIVSQN